MDELKFSLQSDCHGDIEVDLLEFTDDMYADYSLPLTDTYVYNDNKYQFILNTDKMLPTQITINDEIMEFSISIEDGKTIIFPYKLRPFLECYGAVRIEITFGEKIYITNSISVMISKNTINRNVEKMVDYIYDNSEQFLYEEHRYSKISSGFKPASTISIDSKLALLNKIYDVYKKAFHTIKINPYSKIIQTTRVDSFEKLQSISSQTIQYIIQHADELRPVNFNTGITINKQNYQPSKTLISSTIESTDVFENQIIIGFIKTILTELSKMKEEIEIRIKKSEGIVIDDAYIDSKVHIYTRSRKALIHYCDLISQHIKNFQQVYRNYVKILKCEVHKVQGLPKYTPVFKSKMPYRQIYQEIKNWFSCGNYDLQKHELLLSFISISKIYEYYCLVKLLKCLSNFPEVDKIQFVRFLYTETKYYHNMRYNNTFIFRCHDKKITLYFHPVIYSIVHTRPNNIELFRNTSLDIYSGKKIGGKTYTPDYLLKCESDGIARYLIIDAKHSTPDNIRQHQLAKMVCKYLFSITPLNQNDIIEGLYLFCGKTDVGDDFCTVHNIAVQLNKPVIPFAEIASITATDTDKNDNLENIIKNFLKE